jgi:hypothetical protein
VTVKKLDKAQRERKAELLEAAFAAREALNGAVARFNELLAQEWAAVEKEAEALNAAVVDLNAFREEVTQGMEDFAGERSEKWQESEAGQNYAAWMEQWEGLRVEEVELERPADVDEPGVDLDGFDQLPDQPE